VGWIRHGSAKIAHMLLLGHRGSRSSRSVPENTFPSFDLALQHGCDGFEFDVRLTADRVAVVCHDARFRALWISRTAALRLPELPTLEDVLERYSGRAFLDIELKVPGLKVLLLPMLARRRPKTGFVISSFLPKVLLELRRLDATIPLGLICRSRRQLRCWRSLPVEYVIAHQALVSRRLIQEMHQAGRKVWVWTVNRRSTMMRLAKWEVDGVISDHTDTLARTLHV
jgi:glycerophosphoryl diester phosphodiesterase